MKKPICIVSFNPLDEGFYDGNLAEQSCKINKMAGLNPDGLKTSSPKNAIGVEKIYESKFMKYENRNDPAFVPDKTMTDPMGLTYLLLRALRFMHDGYSLKKAVNMIPWDNIITSYPLVDKITINNERDRNIIFKDVPLDVIYNKPIIMNVETGK